LNSSPNTTGGGVERVAGSKGELRQVGGQSTERCTREVMTYNIWSSKLQIREVWRSKWVSFPQKINAQENADVHCEVRLHGVA